MKKYLSHTVAVVALCALTLSSVHASATVEAAVEIEEIEAHGLKFYITHPISKEDQKGIPQILSTLRAKASEKLGDQTLGFYRANSAWRCRFSIELKDGTSLATLESEESVLFIVVFPQGNASEATECLQFEKIMPFRHGNHWMPIVPHIKENSYRIPNALFAPTLECFKFPDPGVGVPKRRTLPPYTGGQY